MFCMKGVRKITSDERSFALCFARTMSVSTACAAAGFERRTSFARARNLLERADVQALIRAVILDERLADPSGERAAPAPVGAVDGANERQVLSFLESCLGDAGIHAREQIAQTDRASADVTAENAVSPAAPESPAPNSARITDAGVSPAQSASDAPEAHGEIGESSPEAHGEIGESSSDTCVERGEQPPDSCGDSSSDPSDPVAELARSESRIMREYEKIAFADASKDGDVKIADKLRALEQYRSLVERRAARSAAADGASDALPLLTVNYDYGGGEGDE